MKHMLIILLLISANVFAADPATPAQRAGALEAPEAQGGETIVLKAMIVNPSETDVQKVPIEIPLPREAGKQDIAEMTEGLSLKFNSDQGFYMAMGEIELQPQEEKKIQVVIHDIWRIPENDIQFQKGYLPTLVTLLEDTKYADTAQQLSGSILSRLDKIVVSQNEQVGPAKHIEKHRENVMLMEEIRKDVSFLEKLAAEKMPANENAAQVEGTDLGKGAPSQNIETVTLKVLVKNPSDTEEAILNVDYYPPKEVKEKDIIKAGELEPRYDLNRGPVCMHKSDVELAAGESKVFEIMLRDIWRVEPEKTQEIEIKAAGFAKGLEGTKFEKSAVRIQKEISEYATQIAQKQSKSEGQPIDDHISIFMEDITLLAQMKNEMQKLARLETIYNSSPNTTLESLGIEAPEGEKEAGYSDTPGKKGPEILARTVFAGKALEETTIWRLIFIIIGFLGFVSLLFYLLWWTQIRAEKSLPGN